MSRALWARDRSRNLYRASRDDAGRDLFGRWNARVTFGRIGCDGRTKRHDFDETAATTAFVRACLRGRGAAVVRRYQHLGVGNWFFAIALVPAFIGALWSLCPRERPDGGPGIARTAVRRDRHQLAPDSHL